MRNLQVNTDLNYSNDSFYFEENFEILRYSRVGQSSIVIYTDFENLSGEYDFEQDCIIEDTRENRVKIQRYLTKDGYTRVSEVFGTIEEIADDIGGVNYENIDELYEILDDIGVSYTSNYIRMETRGHSQGDYSEILVNAKKFEEMFGVPFEPKDYQTLFDHYFWDNPIFGTIEVSFEYTAKNGINVTYEKEFDFQEWTNDVFDVDGLNIDKIVTEIMSELPYTPDDDEVNELKKALNWIDYEDVNYPCSC